MTLAGNSSSRSRNSSGGSSSNSTCRRSMRVVPELGRLLLQLS